MNILGTHLAISWDYAQPYFYGKYDGKLKDGRECKIEIDWNAKAFTLEGEQVGTDQIKYWLCDSTHAKSLLDNVDPTPNLA